MEPITALYVPGDRPDRFDKAVATGADLVIFDLEDAVAPDRKEFARTSVAAWLHAAAGDRSVQVRVNSSWAQDLESLAGVDHPFELRVPKIESVDQLEELTDAAGFRPVTALIETALGLQNAPSIARHPSVAHIALGESDLASDLGTNSPSVMDSARTLLLFAARAAGLPAPMLSVYPRIQDLDGLRADTERGRQLGWFGRTAVHPSQLAVIADVFRSSDEEVAWSEEVLAAVGQGGVSTLASGEMVDPAMLQRARSVLARRPARR